MKRRRVHQAATGWRWVRQGTATGHLVGGCLESLQHLRGTPYWPDMRGAILFLETSEDCSGPADADALLMDLQNMGVFGEIAGLLVARPYGMSARDQALFIDIVSERTGPFPFPVVANMDFGHTSPQLTMPLGVAARIDGERRAVTITEAAVRAP